jgi:hypothetical protein
MRIGGSSEYCYRCHNVTDHPLVQMAEGGVIKFCAPCAERISHGYLHSETAPIAVSKDAA